MGTLDELQHSVLAFVRLAKGCNLGQVSEVSIPVRFLFVMLGPSSHKESYHQIGRSIATLMSDQVGTVYDDNNLLVRVLICLYVQMIVPFASDVKLSVFSPVE